MASLPRPSDSPKHYCLITSPDQKGEGRYLWSWDPSEAPSPGGPWQSPGAQLLPPSCYCMWADGPLGAGCVHSLEGCRVYPHAGEESAPTARAPVAWEDQSHITHRVKGPFISMSNRIGPCCCLSHSQGHEEPGWARRHPLSRAEALLSAGRRPGRGEESQEEMLDDPGQRLPGAWPQGTPLQGRLEGQPGLHAQRGPPLWQVEPQDQFEECQSVNGQAGSVGSQRGTPSDLGFLTQVSSGP